MSKIDVSIEGTFESRKDAAQAIISAAHRIALGEFSASADAKDNPIVFVTSREKDADLPDAEDVRGVF